MRHRVEIEKIDKAQRLVSGYAYVCLKDNEVVVDHSGEFVDDPLEMQKAAHGFVRDSRDGNVMHTPESRGEIVDSIFFTKEMNVLLQKNDGKEGWFITYHVLCDQTWDAVVDGTLQAFSIEGTSVQEAA